MLRTPLIYVAGPYSHPNPPVNTALACQVADLLEEVDEGERLITCYVPHLTMLRDMQCHRSWEDWMDRALTMLARCDALLRIPGESLGSEVEVDHALAWGLPVFATGEIGQRVADARAWARAVLSQETGE